MVAKVKCRFCGASIDKSSAYQDKERKGYYFCNYEHFIESYNKVAKKSISPTLSQGNRVKDARGELIDYIYLLYDKKIPAFVFKQIKDFTTRNNRPFTYKGIELSLRYWIDTLGNPFDGDTGIGIVEYVYDDAEQFWKDKQRVAKAAQDIQIDNVITQGKRTNIEALKYKIKKGGRYKDDL